MAYSNHSKILKIKYTVGESWVIEEPQGVIFHGSLYVRSQFLRNTNESQATLLVYITLKTILSCVCKMAMVALRRLKQGDHDFVARLGNTERPLFGEKKKKQQQLDL